jgi:LacI family transcriptional regulator
VYADDLHGAFVATEHLIRLGHREILLFNAPEYISSAAERHAGYQKAFENNDVSLKPEFVRPCAPRMESAYNLMKGIIAEGVRFSALFTFNDLMAVGAIKALKEAGIRIPADVSIVGFDDIEWVSLIDPPLTTVHIPQYRLGQESARMLFNLFNSKEPQNLILPTELIIRKSCCPPRS